MISPRQRLKAGARIYHVESALDTTRRIDLGKMNDYVEIQSPTDVVQDDGGVVQTWETVDCAYAEIEPMSGKQYFEAASISATVTHRIRIHAPPPYTVTEIMARESVE